MKYIPIVTALVFTLAILPAWSGDSPTLKVVAACDHQYYRHSEGSLTALPDGRWLMAWSRFSGHKDKCGTLGDNGPATIVLAESTDSGNTWSEPRELPVGTATRNIMQAAFVPVKDRLLLAFSVRSREGNTSVKHAIESTDGGKTWSPRRMLFDAGGPNDRAVRLSTGRILMASHRVSKKKFGKVSDNETVVARSDDEGVTWVLSPPVAHVPHPMETRVNDPHPLKTHEPAIAECPDGSLLMFVRTVAGVLYQSRSADKGETWTVLEPTPFASLAAPPYMKRLNDGRLALLWNPIHGKNVAEKTQDAIAKQTAVPYGPRLRLSLALSSDGGKTWSEPRVVAEDGKHGFCYPWMHEDPAGALHIFCARTPYIIYPTDLVQLPPRRP